LVNCLASIPKKAIGLIEFEPKNILDIRHKHWDGMYALLQLLLHICCIKPRKRTLIVAYIQKSTKKAPK